jgi:hypothetical protein
MMFFTILYHGWLSFVRAHYFRRGMGMKLIIGFVIFSILFYMYLAGRQLPAILGEFFPEHPPAFFTFLVYIFFSDFLIRLMGQKVPSQYVSAYLHLPVKKSALAMYTLIRSWFSIYNFYAFAFLIPFLRQTVYISESPGAYYNVLAGYFLLGLLNHSLILFFKVQPREKSLSPGILAGIFLAFIFVGWFFSDNISEVSLNLGMALLNGNRLVFIALILSIAGMQYLAVKNMKAGFYDVAGHALSGDMGSEPGKSGIIDKLLSRVPVYGIYWELEWKLLLRNKRARQNLYQMPLMPFLLFYLLYTGADNLGSMAPFLILATGSYGIIHLQYLFSWESRFFDYIATRNMDMTLFIRSKYYLYSLLALAQLLILTPFILIFNPGQYPFLLGLFLYVTGAVFWYLFYIGPGNSTRIDPNKSAFFNYEGISGNLFISVLLIFLSTIPLYIAGALLPMDNTMGFALVAGLIGLGFIIFSNTWTQHAGRRFLQQKHRYLQKYREK